MPLQFLLDENVDVRLAEFLRAKGHAVLFCSKGLSDQKVAEFAREKSAIFLTNDKDFSDSFLYPPKDFFGIVLFRLHPPALGKLTIAMENLLINIPAQDFPGRLFIVGMEGVEIRQ